MITHEEARKENNLMMKNHVQLTKEKYDWCPLMVGRRKSHYKKIDDYITQQELKEQRAKKVEELLEVYKGIDGGGSPEGLNKLYRLRDELEKELEE
ncbi:MAG: hypothetical protein GX638_16545 [Crenarchaeota archaeon]|nr:hypothetical protein [Thermoproteota archaeon]